MSHRRALLLLVMALTACAAPPETAKPLVERARFGVFFGTEVQERREIPFEVDRSKQVIGFRIELSRPRTEPVEVTWELDMPGDRRGVRDVEGRRGLGRRTKLGRAQMRPGSVRLDQELGFVAQDSLGTWNLRVLVDDEPVIDRPFLVYDPEQRRKLRRESRAELDAERTKQFKSKKRR